MDYSLFMAIHNIDQQADAEATSIYEENTCKGIIRGVNSRGERLLIFIGIIDVLQVYGRARELEHCLKSLCHDGVIVNFIIFDT
jgi:1-phosphatidylinositol-4-phosphate 5-kinase